MKTRDGYSLQPQQQQSQIRLKETTMFLNAMARVAAREGLTIKQLLERKRGEVEKLPPGKQRKSEPKRCDPFKGLSTGSFICSDPWIKEIPMAVTKVTIVDSQRRCANKAKAIQSSSLKTKKECLITDKQRLKRTLSRPRKRKITAVSSSWRPSLDSI